MNLTRTEFLVWMERLLTRFDILSEQLAKVPVKSQSIDGEELLDNQDVMELFKISARSLQRYRSDGKLPYYTISGKLYYKLTDVHEFIRESLATPVRIVK